MSPPVELFHASQLESRIQYDSNGKRRKVPVDLTKCQLQELVQYKCDVADRGNPSAGVTCWPLLRLFRRCADGMTVETTAWEKEFEAD